MSVGRVRARKDGLAVEVRGLLPHPAAAVFAEITEPARIRAHPGVAALIELEAGRDVPHGPGSLREVSLPSGVYRERVLSWDPPWRIDYAVEAASVPIDHHGGSITLTEVPGGTEVLWRSGFSVRMRLVGPLVARWAAYRMADDLAWHLDAVSAALSGRVLPRPQPGPRLAWALLPVALWNLALAGALPESIGSDEGVPFPLLATEHLLRAATVVSLFLLRAHPRATRAEWAVLVAGIVVYCASWLPMLIEPSTVGSPLIALAPALTPMLFLAAFARLARSRVFAVLAAAFLATHVVHQLW